MAKGRRLVWGLLLCLALADCAAQPAPTRPDPPQEVALYAERPSAPLASPQYQRERLAEFRAAFFAPWDAPAPQTVPDSISRDLARLRVDAGVGENLRPRTQAWVEEMAANCGLERYPSAVFPALTLRPTDLRLLPTDKPLFRSSRAGGQGYPFDRLQESRLPGHVPVAVQHISSDGIWALVLTPISSGWARLSDLARVSPEQMRAWRSAPLAAVIKDEVKVAGPDGRVNFLANIGTVLPCADQDAGGMEVLTGVADGEGALLSRRARLGRDQAVLMPLPLTQGNLATVAQVMMGQPYGWGGYLDNRDCSAMVKDIFTPFGLWLPRNSSQQAVAGAAAVDLSGLEPGQKEEVIAREGIPFASLLYLPGHIMLYLGARPEGVMVLHDIWAAGKGSEGGQSLPVGRVVVSNLDLRRAGEEGGDLRRPLRSLVLLLPPEQGRR